MKTEIVKTQQAKIDHLRDTTKMVSSSRRQEHDHLVDASKLIRKAKDFATEINIFNAKSKKLKKEEKKSLKKSNKLKK